MTLILLAQSDFFYTRNGEKVSFKIREDKIVLKAKSGELLQKQRDYLNLSSLNNLDGTHYIATVDVQKQNIEGIKQNQTISDASYMLEYEDGTLQSVTDQIFLQPKKGVSVEQCLTGTGLEKLLKSKAIIIPEDNIYLLTLNVKMADVLSIVRKLQETGLCEFAEPCFLRLIKPQNTLYSQQWGLKNTGQFGGTTGIDIRAEAAWNTTRGNNIKVAVIDDGVDLLHADLQANLLTGYDATTGAPQGVNGSPNSWDAHGTMCAGIIAAINNTIGIVGVASNAKIIPVRTGYDAAVTHNWTFNDSWAINAFNYARNTAQADVISCSWSAGSPSTSLTSAIDNAANNGRNGKGCVIVFSSGNNYSASVNYPANLPNVIAVGAIQSDGSRASYSNGGPALDIVAPGSSIISTDISGTGGYETSSDYSTQSGTSFAAPHVAGVAALVLAVNPSLTRSQVKTVIESTARKVGGYAYSTDTNYPNGTWHMQTGYGLVDAASAVVAATAAISGPSLVPCSGTVTYSIPSVFSVFSWTTSSNLQIVSGQGTNSITVSRTGTNVSRNGWVAVNNTVTKNVSVGALPLTTITGSSSGYTGLGQYAVSPVSSNLTYYWMVSPNTATIYSASNGNCSINFSSPGNYTVSCYSMTSCSGMEQVYPSMSVTISSPGGGGHYSISQSTTSRSVTVTLSTQVNTFTRQTVDYALTNATSGTTVASGNMPVSGGTLDFGHVPAGIYILRIDTGSGTPETFKIILK